MDLHCYTFSCVTGAHIYSFVLTLSAQNDVCLACHLFSHFVAHVGTNTGFMPNFERSLKIYKPLEKFLENYSV